MMNSRPLFSELFYPDRYNCIVCNRELHKETPYGICGGCIVKLTCIQNPCQGCGKEMIAEGRYCIKCKNRRKSFDSAFACFSYNGEIKKLIHRFKYGNKRFLAKYLSVFLVDRFSETDFDPQVVTWVSMHPSKLRKRGYDQAELLARETALRLGLPCEKLVDCVKLHKNFARLSAEERRDIAYSAFECRGDMKGTRILVIDDVLTTGSTMDAVAHALKAAGAKEVFGLTLCTTPISERGDARSVLPLGK